jgi:peptidoglycan/LPS O-acetylase OafA/YrhL
MTPRRHHFALFDGLRGIAALAVVSYHVASITGFLSEGAAGRLTLLAGPLAVGTFFVISGFLLYRPFAAATAEGRPLPGIGAFLRRRGLRIVPGYWAALTLLAIYPGIAGVFSADFWHFYGFLQLYSPEQIGRGIPVAWTLCVEVTYYLALPLWALGVRRLAARAGWVRAEAGTLVAAFALGFVLQVLAARQVIDVRWANALPGQLTWLSLGMAFAVLSVAAAGPGGLRFAERAGRRPGACWLVCAAALAVLVAVTPDGGLAGILLRLGEVQDYDDVLLRIVLGCVVVAGLVAPAVLAEDRPGPVRAVLRFGPIRGLGVISFSFYLWHLTVAQLIGLREDPFHFSAPGFGLVERVDDAATPLLWLATVAVSAAIGTVTYLLVERPFMRLGARRRTRVA